MDFASMLALSAILSIALIVGGPWACFLILAAAAGLANWGAGIGALCAFLLGLAGRIALTFRIRSERARLQYGPFWAKFTLRTNRVVLWTAGFALLLTLPYFLVGLLLLIRGSFEMFPNEDQMSDARLGGMLLTYIGAVLYGFAVPALIRLAGYIRREEARQ